MKRKGSTKKELLSELERLRESQQQYELLSKTAGRLLATDDPQGIVNDLCREVITHLDCQAYFNFLVDEWEGRLRLNAVAGIPEEEVHKIRWLDYGIALSGCVAQDGMPIVAEDVLHDPNPRTDLLKPLGIQACACYPLMAQGRLMGTLSFGTMTRTRFSPPDLSLMKTVSDQVATAIERMRLIAELQRARIELENRVQERTAELQKVNEEQKIQTIMLEQSNRMLKDFASIASHDMQEPLRKVAAFGSRLEQKYGNALGEEGKDYLNRMLDATHRMKSLLDSLLDYSRITTRTQPFREVELSAIIREVLADLEVRIEKTSGEVRVEELPVISADPTQMRQLFQNLIGNALKFHKEGERPLIRVHSIANDIHTCRIVVEDNGIGFEEKHLDRVFAPFQRLHGRSSPYEGAGMGLAICKKIVERHGGSITARTTPGHGSTFTVILPVKQAGMRG